MEITGLHGSNVRILPGQTRELGRAHFGGSKERTISRRHVSFSVPESDHGVVRFEVLGVNPFYVHDERSDEVKVFRSKEKGELRSGDMFCVSTSSPIWYGLRSIESCVGEEGVRRNGSESNLGKVLEGGVGCEGVIEGLRKVDFGDSNFDPVKDFGFVLMGHEFDSYPKKTIRDIKSWDWFLEEEHKDGDDDDDDNGRNVKHGHGRKRKKAAENDDGEWTVDSEGETVIIDKPKPSQKTKYMTRSKDRSKPSDKRSKNAANDQSKDEVEEEEDEDDETLGGFIVGEDDEGVEGDEEGVNGEDEEEEEEEEEERV